MSGSNPTAAPKPPEKFFGPKTIADMREGVQGARDTLAALAPLIGNIKPDPGGHGHYVRRRALAEAVKAIREILDDVYSRMTFDFLDDPETVEDKMREVARKDLPVTPPDGGEQQ